jgi:hypothetical protein
LTRGARFRLSAFLAILAIAVPVLAFDYPLTDDMIRDAYFQGKMPQDRWQDFVAPYAHQLPPPKNDPEVAEIGIETPYLQAAEKSKNATDYLPRTQRRNLVARKCFSAAERRGFLERLQGAVGRGPGDSG